MTFNTETQSKRVMVGITVFILIILAVVVGSMFSESRGRISSEDWKQITHPMTTEEVINQVGRPKNRTSNKNKIKSSYYESLNLQPNANGKITDSASLAGETNVVGLLELEGALEKGAPVEMFHYTINNKDYYVCFIDGQYVVKY